MSIEKIERESGYCGNRSPIGGECMLGCGGFGGCRMGHEDHIRPRLDLFNPLTGEPYPDAALVLSEREGQDG